MTSSIIVSNTTRFKVSEGQFLNYRYNTTVWEAFKNNTSKLQIALTAGTLLEQYLASYNGAFSLTKVAAKCDYVTVEDYADLWWNGTGYKIILDILIKKYPDPTKALPFEEKLRLNQEVTNINWNGEKVRLEASDGSRYNADHVIFTPSVGVLKQISKTLFDPELPQNKQNAIDDIGFDAIMPMHFYFTERWWPERGRFSSFSFIWDEKDKEQFINNVSTILSQLQ